MNKYLERAQEIRSTGMYNCAQAVVLTFAPEIGLTDEQAMGIAGNFGSGMKMGATCGAVTGGLMVLGMIGLADSMTTSQFYRYIKDKHEGYIDCKDLLRINAAAGKPKGPHCDNMVYEAVEFVSQYFPK